MESGAINPWFGPSCRVGKEEEEEEERGGIAKGEEREEKYGDEGMGTKSGRRKRTPEEASRSEYRDSGIGSRQIAGSEGEGGMFQKGPMAGSAMTSPSRCR